MTVYIKINGFYSEIAEGLAGAELELSYRMRERRFVAGDKTIPVSPRRTLKLNILTGTEGADFLAGRAADGAAFDVKCIESDKITAFSAVVDSYRVYQNEFGLMQAEIFIKNAE